MRDAGIFTWDPAFFRRCASLVFEDFPLAEVEARFAPGELETFLLLCIAANGWNAISPERMAEPMLTEILGDLRLRGSELPVAADVPNFWILQ